MQHTIPTWKGTDVFPLSKLALALAVATSGVALLDAIVGGLTGEPTALSTESGMSPVLLLGGLLHAAAYVALALLLHACSHRIDAGSKVRRTLRVGLTVSYLLMAAYFGPVVVYAAVSGASPASLPELLSLPAAIGFLGLFLFSVALGIALLRVPGMRVPGLVLTGVLAGLGLTMLLGAAGSDFAHPAYPETFAYVGAALTGVGSLARARTPVLT